MSLFYKIKIFSIYYSLSSLKKDQLLYIMHY